MSSDLSAQIGSLACPELVVGKTSDVLPEPGSSPMVQFVEAIRVAARYWE